MNEADAAESRPRTSSLPMRVIEILASVGVVAIIVHVIANVIARTIFNAPFHGANEMVGNWYLPIIAFLGFVIAKSRNEHIEATLVYDRLSVKNKVRFSLLANTISVAVLAVFTYFTFFEALDATETKLTSGVTGVVIWPVTWLVPLAFASLTVMYFMDIVRVIRDGAEHIEDDSNQIHVDGIDIPLEGEPLAERAQEVRTP